MKRTSNYAWVICILCTLVYLCSIGLTTAAFSVTVPYIRDSFGFTNTMTTAISTFRLAVSVISVFFLDKVLKSQGSKGTIIIAISCQIIGYILWGFAKSYAWFVVGSILMGITQGFAGVSTVTLFLSNWFISSRGMALSIAACGSGIASLFMPKLVTFIATKYSVSTVFFVVGGIVSAILLLIIFFLSNTPSDMGLKPYLKKNEKEETSSKIYGKGLSPLGKGLLFFIMFLWGYASGIVNVGLTSAYKETGLPSDTVATIMTIYGGAMIVAKIIYGKLCDSKGNKTALFLNLGLFILANGVISLKLHSLMPFALLSAICFGFGATVTSVGISCTPYDFLSEENFVKNVKNNNLFFNSGIMLAGIFTGKLADIFGSYSVSCIIGFAMFTSTLITLAVMYKKQANK